MGIDITCFTEVYTNGAWRLHAEEWPVSDRNSGLFAFLGHMNARQRWYPRIAPPRGIPDDLSPEVKRLAGESLKHGGDSFHTWLTMAEILNYDYEQVACRERVVTVYEDGEDEPSYYTPSSREEGEWRDFTVRETVDPEYLLYRANALKEDLGDPNLIRMVFWFDQEWGVYLSNSMTTEPWCSDPEMARLNDEYVRCQRLYLGTRKRKHFEEFNRVMTARSRRFIELAELWRDAIEVN